MNMVVLTNNQGSGQCLGSRSRHLPGVNGTRTFVFQRIFPLERPVSANYLQIDFRTYTTVLNIPNDTYLPKSVIRPYCLVRFLLGFNWLKGCLIIALVKSATLFILATAA